MKTSTKENGQALADRNPNPRFLTKPMQTCRRGFLTAKRTRPSASAVWLNLWGMRDGQGQEA